MGLRAAFKSLGVVIGKRVPMFDRYTENARRSIFFARWEAIQRGSPSIESAHILLGLLRDPWLASELLKGFSAPELLSGLAGPQPEKEAEKPADIPLSNESKRILAYAAEEADAQLDPHIGSEHLLLGLLREKRSSAARALIEKGQTLESLRDDIRHIPREARKANSGEQGARRRAAGIPDGYNAARLLYNPAAETLVLEVRASQTDYHPRRLLIRHRTVECYEQIGSPAEDISYECPVTCEKQPLVVFNCKRFHKSSGGKYGGADWVGIYIFNLHNRALSLCVSEQNLVLPPPYDERGWITEILGLSDDGSHAYVAAALGKRGDSTKMEVHYDYHVAKMDLRSGQLELISPLTNVCF